MREDIEFARARLHRGPVYLRDAVMYDDPTLKGAHYWWFDEIRNNDDLARRVGKALRKGGEIK